MEPTTFTSVLPAQNDVNFDILSCRLTVDIDSKIFKGVYTAEYTLKKITDCKSDDTWTEGTSSTEDECKLTSVLGADGGSIQATPMLNEGKVAFKIEFLKSFNRDEEIKFTIKYTRPLLRKEVEKGLLFKRYLVIVESIYVNICRNLEVVFQFENKKCSLLESVPNIYISDNEVIRFRKEILKPHEVYTVGLLLHSGFLTRRESKTITVISMLVAGWLVPIILSNLMHMLLNQR